MRRLWPDTGDVDPVEAYLAADRDPPPDRPWVVIGMVSSLDGATALAGRSGSLGGPADKAVFRAVRALADIILVGAGTVRAENYGPVTLSDSALAARRAAGRRADAPRLAIVTADLGLDPGDRVFSDPARRPLVCTTADADSGAVDELDAVAEVRRYGTGRVDVGALLADLSRDGVGVVVSEGGPTLNGALVDAGVVDELCLTLSPLLAGGDSHRIVHRAQAVRREFELASLLIEDDLLFGRWVRAQPGSS